MKVLSEEFIVPGQNNTLRLNYTDPSTNNSYTYEFTLSGIPQSGDSFTLATWLS